MILGYKTTWVIDEGLRVAVMKPDGKGGYIWEWATEEEIIQLIRREIRTGHV